MSPPLVDRALHTRPALTPVPCLRRTEPSAWLCPPPGARRLPDGAVDMEHTDVRRHLTAELLRPLREAVARLEP